MNKYKRNMLNWKTIFPAIFLALIIFIASSFQQPEYIDLSIHLRDKIVHCFVYLVFGLSVQFAFFGNYNSIKLERGKILFIVVLLTSLYGASDEIHQYFVPGRSCDFFDWVADTLGGIFSLVFSKKIDNFSIRYLLHNSQNHR